MAAVICPLGTQLVQLPALCKHCGALFPSGFDIGNAGMVVASGNIQQCPFCGRDADVFDGTFSVAENAIDILQSGSVTTEMLKRLREIAKKARSDNTTFEAFAKQADAISPILGALVRQSSGKIPFATFLLIVILIATQSCTMNVTLDANKLIDQIKNKSPEVLIQETEKQDKRTGTDSTENSSGGDAPPENPQLNS